MKHFEPSLRFARSAALAAFTLGLLAVPEANALVAPMCGSGPACPQGFVCETFSGACPAIDCLEGEECLPCMPADEQICVSAPCSSDADCAPGMGCSIVEYTTCPTEPAPGGGAEPGCAPDADGTCTEPKPVPDDARAAAPAECTTETSSQCLPRWQLECEADADCGPGFTCDAIEQCSCPGSTGSGTPGADGSAGGGEDPDAMPPPDAEARPAEAPIPSDFPIDDSGCTCEPSDQKSCTYEQTACEVDADCAAGWTCRDNPTGVCWSDADGNMGCEPADPPKVCMPPYSDLYYGVPTGEGTPEAGSGTPTRGDDASGDADDSSALSNGGDSPSSSSGGCSLAAAGGSRPALGGLALFGALLALGLRRRRTL